MSAGSDEFLFVNFDKRSLGSKKHLGLVNAHVHANARAKKRKQEISEKSSHSEAAGSPTLPERIGQRTPVDHDLSRAPSRVQSVDEEGQEGESTAEATARSLTTTPSASGAQEPKRLSDVFATSVRLRDQASGRIKQSITKSPSTEMTQVTAATTLKDPSFYQPLGSAALDSFPRLPMPLSREERNFVHIYVNHLGPSIYGTRKDASFDPSKHVSLPNMLNDALVMRWCIIGAEAFSARQRGIVESPRSLLGRRANAYRMMNDRLQDPEQDLETAFGCMLAAVISDSRELGPDIANLHLRGLGAVVEKRGGMKALFGDKKVAGGFTLFVWAHHHTSNAGGIADLRQLNKYKSDFFKSLRGIQAFNRDLCIRLRRLKSRGATRRILAGSEALTSWDADRQIIELYRKARWETLRESCLKPLLDAHFPYGASFAEECCHYSNLFNLNLSLWILKNDLPNSTLFLDRLRKTFNNGVVDPVTGRTSLKQTYLYWALSIIRMKIESNMVQREVFIGERLIQALRLRPLLSESSLYTLLRAFSSYLIAEEEDDLVVLSDSDLDDMETEITRNFILPGG